MVEEILIHEAENTVEKLDVNAEWLLDAVREYRELDNEGSGKSAWADGLFFVDDHEDDPYTAICKSGNVKWWFLDTLEEALEALIEEQTPDAVDELCDAADRAGFPSNQVDVFESDYGDYEYAMIISPNLGSKGTASANVKDSNFGALSEPLDGVRYINIVDGETWLDRNKPARYKEQVAPDDQLLVLYY